MSHRYREQLCRASRMELNLGSVWPATKEKSITVKTHSHYHCQYARIQKLGALADLNFFHFIDVGTILAPTSNPSIAKYTNILFRFKIINYFIRKFIYRCPASHLFLIAQLKFLNIKISKRNSTINVCEKFHGISKVMINNLLLH